MADASMNYLYTIGGYATLIGLGYVVYQVSTKNAGRRGAAAAPRTVKTTHQEPRKEDRKKKQRMESFASEAQEAAKAKSRINAAEEPKPAPVSYAAAAAADSAKDEVDNREFARQLAKAKEGTKFASKSDGSKQREKSVKQSRANQITDKAAADKAAADKPVAPLSTTSADADDDRSPATSPETSPVDASGVSDMLEPAPAGPSVLRITDSGKQEQKKKATKAPEKVETKKQRQNRKKAEAAKAARDEAEKDRKALEEKQRRAARIAEGRAAKDGSQFQAAQSKNSAWAQGAPNGNSAGKTPDAAVLHQPLDTFEEKPVTTTVKPAAAKSEGSWMSSLPSEEEQMEMLKQDADEWSTVQTKASKKSKKASSVSSADEKAQPRPAAQPQQPTSGASKAAKPTPSQNFGGSFSALTTNDDGAEEAEEEWEV